MSTSETVQAAQRLQITGTLVQMGGDDVPRLQIECEDGAIVEVANVPKELLAAMPPLLYKRVTLTVEAERQPGPAPEFIISPIVCPGTPDAHTLTLKIGAQSFRINGHVDFDTREEAAWMADQLLRALAKMQQPPMPVTDFNLYTSPQQPDAAYLARWANAPADATHLAQNTGGDCTWFAEEPWCDYDGVVERWYARGWFMVAPKNSLGRVACEPRPRAEGER